ncbi:hypothetical protein CPB83DRAFT_861526 [Crepidotus variabilis]|uniref:Wax synthase domain-containing protein n=1 Tax=Crepidotus variabilis TaxID=179855 RepID=A0A9P6E7V5_9AGAR|nr:hypothetical protein CPB83DRAFT_861526 [Crepidotus variabilis]
MVTVWQEITFGAARAFRTIVPTHQNRIPLTWNNGIQPIALYAPFIFLAYLSRREDTHLIRLLLLPSVITCIISSAYRYTFTIPQLNVYNWGQGLLAAVTIAKALEFAFTPEGMLKVGESRPGVTKGKARSPPPANGKANGNGHASYTPSEQVWPADERSSYIATWFYDAIEVAHTLRGLKWKFGRGLYVPPPTRPTERGPYIRATLRSFVINFFLLDLLESFLKLFPGVGEPTGGTMFYPSLSLPARYFTSTVIHMLTGASILFGFGMIYDLITLIAVCLFDSEPASWPPVMGDPWHADSMHRFWSKDWHQLLRQTFYVYGGLPGKWLFGDFGMLFGMFLASGLFHECAMYAMSRGFEYHAIVFFGSQGFILLGERLWRKVVGRRVSGVIGRLWVYTVMFIGPQMMIDSWHRRGLGGGMVIPPMLSPARWIYGPLLMKLLQANRNN